MKNEEFSLFLLEINELKRNQYFDGKKGKGNDSFIKNYISVCRKYQTQKRNQ
jgi:hypothetical protein